MRRHLDCLLAVGQKQDARGFLRYLRCRTGRALASHTANPLINRIAYNSQRRRGHPQVPVEQFTEATGEVSVPTYDALKWPTLQALNAMGGSASNEELLNKIIEVAGITPTVEAVQHTDH